ncbi:DUF4238 domain-containing protein [Adhaeribacter radiodurans]|uniref:DUF4238 domain-containing protein n=1 Tax=Adhaeribacter radiodurans TaxID=2745197 RepID=A0A7L7L176_9BACT|nr:DUF4238 domain-containing protein [Adhaeribacter radiodurans]QMU26537.1 DUF4238 domain-containing protein [Adhaeribacter radiodurans]
MKYNYYERKSEEISKEQSIWIETNIEIISESENVLFVFQAEKEVLLITDKSIFFPSRNTRNKISYNEIKNIKIAGDLSVKIFIDAETFTIDLVAPIDKVKIFHVLQLFIDNSKKNISTTFEDTHKILNEFIVLKYPLNQSQHKLPQVYLKQFGYLKGNQWMVSILEKELTYSKQKSIGSFTTETNVFDIDSEDDRLPRMFETMNADLENLYHEMLDDISKNKFIPDKCWEIIVQLTPNLMVRSDYWRNFVCEILETPNRETFLLSTLSVHAQSVHELQELKNRYFYKVLSEGEINQSKVNRILLHFLNYIFHHLLTFDLIIIEAPEDKGFFTSDNPVNFKVNREEGQIGLYNKNTEIFFPLSKNYLAYFHHKNSSEQNAPLRKLKNRGVYKVEEVLTEDEYTNLIQEEIIKNSDKLIIFPGEVRYRKER